MSSIFYLIYKFLAADLLNVFEDSKVQYPSLYWLIHLLDLHRTQQAATCRFSKEFCENLGNVCTSRKTYNSKENSAYSLVKSFQIQKQSVLSGCEPRENLHCKPGEANTRLITASCEAGPGTTHMWILEICIRSLLILDFAARCVFHNSIFGLF